MNRLALALLAIPLTGCEELQPFLPTVAFDSLSVNEVSWEAIDTDFVFQVDNPNPIEVPLASFDYILQLGGIDLLSGDDPDGLTLLADDSSELALPVAMEFESLYEAIQAIRGEDDIPFGLAGHFGFDTPLGAVDLPYDASGEFPALRTPVVELGKVKIKDITLTDATVDVKLNIDNDHASTIWFDNFDYTLKFAGDEVASGMVQELGGVEGASVESVSLPIELSFIELGSSIYDVLTGDSVKVKLVANTDVDTPFGIIPLSISESGTVSIEK